MRSVSIPRSTPLLDYGRAGFVNDQREHQELPILALHPALARARSCGPVQCLAIDHACPRNPFQVQRAASRCSLQGLVLANSVAEGLLNVVVPSPAEPKTRADGAERVIMSHELHRDRGRDRRWQDRADPRTGRAAECMLSVEDN